jgi:hypothetical protein
MATELEHPRYFLQASQFIWHQIEHAVGDDYIGPVVRNRQCLAVACSKLDVGQTSCTRIMLGFTQHLGGHIYTDDLPRWPNHRGRYHTVDTGASSTIHHTVTGVQFTEAEGVAGAGEGLDRALWNAHRPGFLIAEQSREATAGMEMEAFCGMECDLSILCLNSCAELLAVNVNRWGHGDCHRRPPFRANGYGSFLLSRIHHH